LSPLVLEPVSPETSIRRQGDKSISSWRLAIITLRVPSAHVSLRIQVRHALTPASESPAYEGQDHDKVPLS
jgi:hypothetical protein